MKLITCCVALCPTLAFAAPAQEEQPDPAAQARIQKDIAKLQRALRNTAQQQKLGFRATHLTRRESVPRGGKRRAVRVLPVGTAAGGGGRPADNTIASEGMRSGIFLYHKLNGGKDDVLTVGRRSIARRGGEWVPRKGCLWDGSPAFLFDPELFCSAVGAQELTILRTDPGVHESKPVEVHTLTFGEKLGHHLVWAGALPNPGAPTYGGRRVNSGLNRPLLPAQKVIVDVALYVEPGRGIIRRAKIRSYAFLGRRTGIKVLGGGIRKPDEDVEDTPGVAALPFKDGLPVRKPENHYVMDFDVTFDDETEAKLPELDARAKQLLGLR